MTSITARLSAQSLFEGFFERVTWRTKVISVEMQPDSETNTSDWERKEKQDVSQTIQIVIWMQNAKYFCPQVCKLCLLGRAEVTAGLWPSRIWSGRPWIN